MVRVASKLAMIKVEVNVKYVLSLAAFICLCACIGFGQENNVPDQGLLPDYAGRPVEPVGSPPPAAVPAVPAQESQSFDQSVKDIYFAFDRSDITSDDQTTLQQDAEWLKAHPDAVFTIEGDADPRGDIVYNVYLSDARALAARDELVRLGVPEHQILFAEGWGELYPVCQQEDESCWSKDRRAHFAPWSADDLPIVGPGAASTAASVSQPGQ